MKNSLYWTSTTTYIDIETGEVIKKRTKKETIEEVQNKYYIIKTIKYVSTGNGKGNIEYTIQCRRKPHQLQFFN